MFFLVALRARRDRRGAVRRLGVPRDRVLTERGGGLVRIGVVADTHVGELLPELPGEVCEALAGVDLILHAGDIIDPAALEVLRAVAPVVAVRGNHDNREVRRDLPRDVLVRVGGVRIGLTHGHRRTAAEIPAILVSSWPDAPSTSGSSAPCSAVFRAPTAWSWATSTSRSTTGRGAYCCSPPAPSSRPSTTPASTGAGARARAYRRYRRGLPPEAHPPAVGLIEAGPGVLRARVIPLLRPVRAVT